MRLSKERIKKSKDFIRLQREWYTKLKESGFEDIENVPANGGVIFTKPALRFDNVKGDFWTYRKEYQDFFRVIGLYAHHYPLIQGWMKAILVEYAQCGSIPKAIRACGGGTTKRVVGYFIKMNLKYMIEFVNKLELEDVWEMKNLVYLT